MFDLRLHAAAVSPLLSVQSGRDASSLGSMGAHPGRWGSNPFLFGLRAHLGCRCFSPFTVCLADRLVRKEAIVLARKLAVLRGSPHARRIPLYCCYLGLRIRRARSAPVPDYDRPANSIGYRLPDLWRSGASRASSTNASRPQSV